MTDWPDEFAALLALRTGLQLSSSLRERLAGVLAARAEAAGAASVADYVHALQQDRAPQEMQQLINILTVCKTSFWRYPHHIHAIVDELVPALHKLLPHGLPLNIWSVACATGEEPYTLAMALHAAGWYSRRSINILATDINTDALAHARAGRYTLRRDDVDSLPATARPYLQREASHYRIAPQIAQAVDFRHLNLHDAAYPSHRSWHIVVCANVLIYFPAAVILDVIGRLSDSMARNGALMLGGAESLPVSIDQLTVLRIGGAFAYAKGDWDRLLRRFEIAARRPRSSAPPAASSTASAETARPPLSAARTRGRSVASAAAASEPGEPNRVAPAGPVDTARNATADAQPSTPQPARDARACRQRAMALFEQRHFDDALGALEDAVSADPLAFDLHFYIGWILRRRAERHEALQAYRRALFLAPSFGFARYEFALTLHELGFFDDAVQEYLRAEQTAADPSMARSLDAMGSRRDPFWSNSQLVVELCRRNRPLAEQQLEPVAD